MRKTIYISERRSKDIADFIKDIPAKDISHEAVKLMEDGMKWRAMGNDEAKGDMEKRSGAAVSLRQAEIPAVEKAQTGRAAFSDIKLEKKQLDRGELEAKFNNL